MPYPKELAHKLSSRYQQLLQKRQSVEAIIGEITNYVHPQRMPQQTGVASSHSSQRRLYDSTAIIAADQLASCLWSFACDSATSWFRLSRAHQGDKILYELEQDIYSILDANRFYSASHEFFRDLVSFGTAFFVCDGNAQSGEFLFKAIHPLDCAFEEDATGEITTIFRKILQDDPAHNCQKEQIHVVIKNHADLKEYTALPWVSIFMDAQKGMITHIAGYHENPYMVARFHTRSQQPWGESPAMQALADIKTLNLMVKNNLIAAQKQVDPPLLASDELFARGLRAEAGSIIYGGIDGNSGIKRLEPLAGAGNVSLGLEMEEKKRNIIREAFYYQLIHHFNLQKTATQAVLDQEDKLRLIYPLINRVFAEFLRPCVLRLAHILLREKYGYYEQDIHIQSYSALALAKKRNDANKKMQSIHHLMPLLNMNPQLLEQLNIQEVLSQILNDWGFHST